MITRLNVFSVIEEHIDYHNHMFIQMAAPAVNVGYGKGEGFKNESTLYIGVLGIFHNHFLRHPLNQNLFIIIIFAKNAQTLTLGGNNTF